MEKKDKKRRRSVRLLSQDQTTEKEDVDNALIRNFEDKYGSIWKDFSPNYVAARRKSTTRRRSSFFKQMSVPLLEQDVETAELSVNFVPRVDSPELTRGPDDLSANYSLSVVANSSAVMSNQQIDKSTSSMNDIDIETPKSLSGKTAENVILTPSVVGNKKNSQIEEEFQSPDYPEGIFIVHSCSDVNLCQSPLFDSEHLSPIRSGTPEMKKIDNHFSTPCAHAKLDDDSVAYSPSQPVFSTPSWNLQKSPAEVPYSPSQPIFEIEENNVETTTDISKPCQNLCTQLVNDSETKCEHKLETDKLSNRKQTSKKLKDKLNQENSVGQGEGDKIKTSRFFSIFKSLATTLANVVRKTPENDSEKQAENLESTIQEYLPNSEDLSIVKANMNTVNNIDFNCETKLEFQQDRENETNNQDKISIGIDKDCTYCDLNNEVADQKVERSQYVRGDGDDSVSCTKNICDIDDEILRCTEDADSVSGTILLTKHTGDSDEEILKRTEDVDLKSKVVFRNNESNALSDRSNENKCQSEQFTKVKVVAKDKSQINAEDDVTVANDDKDPSMILGAKFESLKQNREENTNNIKLLPSKCAEILQLEIPIQRKRGRPRRKSIDPQVLATMTSRTSIKSKAETDVKTSDQKSTCTTIVIDTDSDKLKKKRERPARRKSADPTLLSKVREVISIDTSKETNILLNHMNSDDFDQIKEFLMMDEAKPVAKKGRGLRRSADSVTLSRSMSEISTDENVDIPVRRNTRLKRRSTEIYQAGKIDQDDESESFVNSPHSLDENNLPRISDDLSNTCITSKTKPARKRKLKEENIEDIYKNKNFKPPVPRVWETIYEFPDKLKDPDQMLSKKRFKRSIAFESLLPAKLKKRSKKAAVLGWDAKRRMKLELPDEIVIEKLSELDAVLNC